MSDGWANCCGLDRVEAPWLIDGPINGERFRLYVEKVLLPTLRPDDIVVVDLAATAEDDRRLYPDGRRQVVLPKGGHATTPDQLALRNGTNRGGAADFAVTCPVLHDRRRFSIRLPRMWAASALSRTVCASANSATSPACPVASAHQSQTSRENASEHAAATQPINRF